MDAVNSLISRIRANDRVFPLEKLKKKWGKRMLMHKERDVKAVQNSAPLVPSKRLAETSEKTSDKKLKKQKQSVPKP